MSSYLPKLYQAIGDRLTGDTGTGGLFNVTSPLVTQFRNTVIASSQAFPYLVMNVTTAMNSDGFNLRSHMVTFSIHVYVEEQPNAGGDSFSTGASIIDRVEGDWDLQSTRIPSFGLDRWVPTLTSSSWTCSQCVLLNSSEAHDPGVLHWILDFRVYVNKAGA